MTAIFWRVGFVLVILAVAVVVPLGAILIFCLPQVHSPRRINALIFFSLARHWNLLRKYCAADMTCFSALRRAVIG